MSVAAFDSAAAPLKTPLPLFDRDLSWLEFNHRVLSEARNPDVPLLERVKFLSICSTNLDEFFMIRVGELRDLIVANIADSDKLREKLDTIRRRSYRLLEAMYACLGEELLPALKKEGIRLEKVADLGKRERVAVEDYFTRSLEPILTPLAIDPGHPFPLLANLTLNLGLLLESERGDTHAALLKIPETVPRFFSIDPNRFVLLEDVIASHVGRLFPGLRVRAVAAFRVVRNSDLSIKEEDVQDLLKTMESELRRRDRREVVLIEIESGAHDAILKLLVQSTQIEDADVFFATGPLKLGDLMQVYAGIPDPRLKDEPFNPRIPTQLASSEDIFSIIRKGDILLHRPYDSFTAVIELVQAAAEDPDVMAIKQTLYRTDRGSPIIEALTLAASRGKQVTAVVELQARFDERKNISWARHLEDAGVQVVYGLLGIKTHCKFCLVVRGEGEELRRYLHLSTGNYNAVTGRLYTDLDLFTCEPELVADAAQLMNLLTGFTVGDVQGLTETKSSPLKWKRMVVAPMDYLRWTIAMIDRETANAAAGKPASIIAKMNALVEPTVIDALYRASRAGVRIELLVRGICCLVPGLPGLSETIRVTSVVDRFLEHERVFRFENGGDAEVFMSSGDWMPRNFLRRIETTWPLLDPLVRKRVEKEILPICLADNVKGWTLDPDGKYRRRTPGDSVPIRSQEKFIEIARAEAVRLGPYDEIIRRPGSFRRKAKKKKKH
ncbi:MAG TPA: polyphosphate kinase 1 [Thermoanaerobaculia bacterium]|nr:polyphosphate kinase 1 [Thermoanaerobaculia bacterium]